MLPLLYHRSALSYREALELLFDRGLEVSRESIRTWCINFSSEFGLSRKPRAPGL
ncbi:hypothetical protein [Deinococcus sp. Arct2-2]|uniref:hypothetical protein n=1 Tax=Deinococcus sp. Arct2-2 TaxID=2568653 RepID=UPI001454D0F2|nr:hypothetical protein [Deinococcus sp. Arct2-2]